MASSSDVRDILGLEASSSSGPLTKEKIFASMAQGAGNKRRSLMMKGNKEGGERNSRRPEGMARELYNLLYNDSKDAPPIIPTDTNMGMDRGYKMRAKIGMRRVRPWKWMPFTNPARKDGLILYHWRRAADEGKDYPFSRFNKRIEMPTFSDLEYQTHLSAENWSRKETDHLLDLCGRFDLRFTVVHDRWDRHMFRAPRSVEDLKERYYGLVEKLEMLTPQPLNVSAKTFVYDADHERRRKEQLNKLYNRTPEEIEEEEMLRKEVQKIQLQKKEREKKTQDLQKLIAMADSSSSGAAQMANKGGSDSHKKNKKKSLGGQMGGGVSKSGGGQQHGKEIGVVDMAGIKWPDHRGPGVTLRSQRIKLPPNVGQRRSKAIDQMLVEVQVEAAPTPTEEICTGFNELRSDMVLLYELKNALSTCEVELQSLKAQFEAVSPGKTLEIPEKLRNAPTLASTSSQNRSSLSTASSSASTAASSLISDVIDVVGNGSTPTVRKRKAALEQSNMLKKIKNKNY